ncbi:MAG: hypothetical protein DWQ49_09930 [Bacteroidetes bacterium]|nr:MAG: hypothetical protein DWQ49_09930 [Bacteroidota bacterium]
MPLSNPILQGQGNSQFTNSVATDAAFTPPADSLLLAIVQVSGAANPTSITGHGAWSTTPIATVDDFYGERFSVFSLQVGSSPSSDSITVTYGASYNAMSMVVIAYTGYNTGTPIVQSATLQGEINPGPTHGFTVNLAAFGSANNRPLLALGTPAGATFTEDSAGSWTELTEYIPGQSRNIAAQYHGSSADNTCASTANGGQYTPFSAIALEIADAGPGASTFTGNPINLSLNGSLANSYAQGTVTGSPVTYTGNPFSITFNGNINNAYAQGDFRRYVDPGAGSFPLGLNGSLAIGFVQGAHTSSAQTFTGNPISLSLNGSLANSYVQGAHTSSAQTFTGNPISLSLNGSLANSYAQGNHLTGAVVFTGNPISLSLNGSLANSYAQGNHVVYVVPITSDIQDLILIKTGGPTLHDGLLAHYKSNGATSDCLCDAEREFLIVNGASLACNVDMWNEYLSGLGYVGDIHDKFLSYWANQ